MKNLVLLICLFISTLTLSAQEKSPSDLESNEAAVKTVVENFLTAAGNYDINAMPALFAEKANIGGASLRNGEWNTFTMTLEEFMDVLKSRDNPEKYTEPVSKFTIHITEGMLAFVKADAVFIQNGKAQSNNFDYFTLMKLNGNWKILNGSYVSIPIEK